MLCLILQNNKILADVICAWPLECPAFSNRKSYHNAVGHTLGAFYKDKIDTLLHLSLAHPPHSLRHFYNATYHSILNISQISIWFSFKCFASTSGAWACMCICLAHNIERRWDEENLSPVKLSFTSLLFTLISVKNAWCGLIQLHALSVRFGCPRCQTTLQSWGNPSLNALEVSDGCPPACLPLQWTCYDFLMGVDMGSSAGFDISARRVNDENKL